MCIISSKQKLNQTILLNQFSTCIKDKLKSNIKEIFSYLCFNINCHIYHKRNIVANNINKVYAIDVMIRNLQMNLNKSLLKNLIQMKIYNLSVKTKNKIKSNFLLTVIKYFNLMIRRSKRKYFDELIQINLKMIQQILRQNEEGKNKIEFIKKEIKLVDEECINYENIVKLSILRAEKCGKCIEFLSENYITNTINSIKEDFINVNAYRSNSLLNTLQDKDFNIPSSRNIYQKTDKDSFGDKDFNIPVSKDIYQRTYKSESLLEKDFNIPTSKDILRKSDSNLSLKNYYKLTRDDYKSNKINRDEDSNIIENEFETINKEYSMDEATGMEYLKYLENTFNELSNKKDQMEFSLLFKLQNLKAEIQVKSINI